MKMPLIIVEIPHQSPADAWVAYGEEDFILAANRVKDMEYDLWTMEDARDCFGDPEDIPADLLEILSAEGNALGFGFSGETEWLKVGDAPSELEAAEEALFRDLHAGFILDEEEARRFASGSNDIYNGHQRIEAQTAVRKLLANF